MGISLVEAKIREEYLNLTKIVIPAVIGFMVVAIVIAGSTKMGAGYRGVLLTFGAVDTNKSVEEGFTSSSLFTITSYICATSAIWRHVLPCS
jgi:hypothetical protein